MKVNFYGGRKAKLYTVMCCNFNISLFGENLYFFISYCQPSLKEISMGFEGTEERDLGTMEKPNHGHENRIYEWLFYIQISCLVTCNTDLKGQKFQAFCKWNEIELLDHYYCQYFFKHFIILL